MRRLFVVLLFLAAAARAETYALKGTLVTPDEVIENGVLVVTDGTITAAGANAAIPDGARVVDTGGFIYPGLIDLHNHLTWNAHPRWSAGTLTRARYEWQAMDAYAVGLSGPQAKLSRGTPSYSCDLARFAEVKVAVWGGTSVAGSLPLPCSAGLVRNLDYTTSGLGVTQVQYRIFPLELNENDEKSVRDALAAENPVIVHLCEGTDASAARELRQARAHGFLKKGFIIIHGVPLLEKDFEELGKNGVGFVWSPRSNIELYGKTANVAAAKKSVTLAIAPDWSPSGSNGMIEEMRYAAIWSDQQFPPVFTAKELVLMATTNPAKLARIDGKTGKLAAGLAADYVVVRRREGRDPYSSLIYATHEDMLLVAVGGKPIYGEAAMIADVNPSARVEALDVCGAPKGVDTSDSSATWADTMKNLRTGFKTFSLPMAGLAECP